MQSEERTELATLPVAVCTAEQRGARDEARRVICPIRGEGIAVESCVQCPRVVDVVRDASLAVSAVRCEVPSSLVERQLLRRRVSRLAASQTRIASLLARDVLCLGPELVDGEAAELLVAARTTEAVVVDSGRRPVGLVFEADLLDAVADSPRRCTVAELMSPIAITIVETASLATAAALMARDRLGALVVVDGEGRVVGLITPFDLVDWLAPSLPSENAR
jgi:CBS domain-containing protein